MVIQTILDKPSKTQNKTKRQEWCVKIFWDEMGWQSWKGDDGSLGADTIQNALCTKLSKIGIYFKRRIKGVKKKTETSQQLSRLQGCLKQTWLQFWQTG